MPSTSTAASPSAYSRFGSLYVISTFISHFGQDISLSLSKRHDAHLKGDGTEYGLPYMRLLSSGILEAQRACSGVFISDWTDLDEMKHKVEAYLLLMSHKTEIGGYGNLSGEKPALQTLRESLYRAGVEASNSLEDVIAGYSENSEELSTWQIDLVRCRRALSAWNSRPIKQVEASRFGNFFVEFAFLEKLTEKFSEVILDASDMTNNGPGFYQYRPTYAFMQLMAAGLHQAQRICTEASISCEEGLALLVEKIDQGLVKLCGEADIAKFKSRRELDWALEQFTEGLSAAASTARLALEEVGAGYPLGGGDLNAWKTSLRISKRADEMRTRKDEDEDVPF